MTTDDQILTEDLPQHISIVGSRCLIFVEGQSVLESKTFSEAVLLFVTLHYVLDLQYVKNILSTMTFLQKIIIGIGGEDLSSKLASLKEKLID